MNITDERPLFSGMVSARPLKRRKELSAKRAPMCAHKRTVKQKRRAKIQKDKRETDRTILKRYHQSEILQFAINTSKPPAPVALEGRLCQSAKPHEYKRSLVWLNLPPLANLGIPRAGVATALNLHAPAVTGAPLHPTSPPPKISSLNKKKKNCECHCRWRSVKTPVWY